MRMTSYLITTLVIFNGCSSALPFRWSQPAQPATALLDQYFEITQVGDSLLQRVRILMGELKILNQQGDSLIEFYEEVQNNSTNLSEENITGEIESYLEITDRFGKDFIQFKLDYGFYDKMGIRFMEKIEQSSNRLKILKVFTNNQLDIQDFLFGISAEYDRLLSTQALLIQTGLTLSSELQFHAIQTQMDQWDNINKEWSKQYE